MPELATKANQLYEETERLRLAPKLDTFTLNRLQREANNLLKVDAFNAYQILGALASFEGNITRVRENYEKALNLASINEDKAMILNNYAVSMGIMGYFSEAAKLGIESYNIFPSLRRAKQNIHHFMRAGLFHHAAELTHKIDNLDLDNGLFSLISRTTRFMDKHGVSDEELQKLIEITITVLHARQFFDFHYNVQLGFLEDEDSQWFHNVQLGFLEDEDSQWFRYVIKVNRSVEEIIEMIYELANQLAEVDLPIKLTSNFITAYEIAEE